MGYSITSNIFNMGPKEQDAFQDVSCMALILCDEKAFADKPLFNRQSLEILEKAHEASSGEPFVFFFTGPPPADYQAWEHQRGAFKDAQAQYPLDLDQRRNLTLDLARCLGLDISDLPAVVVSPALWKPGVHLVLRSLRTAGEIAQVLQHAQAVSQRLAATQQLKSRFEFIREAFAPAHDDCIDLSQLEIEESRFNNARLAAISSFGHVGPDAPLDLREVVSAPRSNKRGVIRQDDQWAELAVDLLLLQTPESLPSVPSQLELLDETSRQMYATAEALYPLMSSSTDCSPAASGYWKTVEREFGLSVIEALRADAGITMPCFYRLWEKGKGELKREDCKVGNGESLKLNKKLRSDKSRIELPSLGNTRTILEWAVQEGVIEMRARELERKRDLLFRLNKIRNFGSHTEALHRKNLEEVKSDADEILEALIEIKRKNGFPPGEQNQDERSFQYPDLDELAANYREKLARQQKAKDRSAAAAKPPGANRARPEHELSDFAREVIESLCQEEHALADGTTLSQEDSRRLVHQVMRKLRSLALDLHWAAERPHGKEIVRAFIEEQVSNDSQDEEAP